MVAAAASLSATIAVVWSLLGSIADRQRQLGPGAQDRADSVDAGSPVGAANLSAPLFPGVLSATDAALGGSVWYLLDRVARRVHRFGEAGALLGSFARGGEGPGELAFPTAIAVHRDTVVVADRQALRLYDSTGAHVADRRLSFGGCLAPRIADVESASLGILLMVLCANPARGIEATVFLATPDRAVRLLASRSPEGRGVVADIGFTPVMSAHASGFVFGDADGECLDLFDDDAALAGTVCHGWIPRLPLSRRSAAALERQVRQAADAVGARVIVPRRLPPFDRVFPLGDGRLAYRVPVLLQEAWGTDADGVDLFRLIGRGEAGGEEALPVPTATAIFASGASALAAWPALDGVRVAVYPQRAS